MVVRLHAANACNDDLGESNHVDEAKKGGEGAVIYVRASLLVDFGLAG